MYLLVHIPHTYDLVVITSLTHPRKILLVGKLEIGKAKDLSAPLCMWEWRYNSTIHDLSTRWRRVVSFMPRLLYP
jgi:hypothetical protein